MTIPGYEQFEEIGAGGMGVVYRAREVGLGRTVAIKMLHTLSDEAMKRFTQEARAIARIGPNPHFTAIYSFGSHEDRPYIVMEYLDGTSLDIALGRGGVLTTVEAKVEVARQVCEGLEFAHDQGIVAHRDIKPTNIQLTTSGVVKIMDFGIAKLADDLCISRNLTRTNMIVGTIPYMSPEQIKGEKLDGRTDIWSTGILLYEMLYGRPPFDSTDDLELMKSIVLDEIRFGTLDVPHGDELRCILLKALEKDRDRRFPRAAELAAALKAYGRTVAESAIHPKPDLKTARDYFYEGKGYFEQGHLARAISCFHKVLELDPARAQAHKNIAICIAAQNERRARELRKLATLLFNNKDYGAALPVAQELMQIAPSDEEGRALLDWTLGALRRPTPPDKR